jgi:hypothetical protein
LDRSLSVEDIRQLVQRAADVHASN